MSDAFFEYMKRVTDDGNNYQNERRNEFDRLSAEQPKTPKVGDNILAAVGLIGHGFAYIRQEAKVIETSGNNSRIQWKSKYCDDIKEEWITNILVIEILNEDSN